MGIPVQSCSILDWGELYPPIDPQILTAPIVMKTPGTWKQTNNPRDIPRPWKILTSRTLFHIYVIFLWLRRCQPFRWLMLKRKRPLSFLNRNTFCCFVALSYCCKFNIVNSFSKTVVQNNYKRIKGVIKYKCTTKEHTKDSKEMSMWDGVI